MTQEEPPEGAARGSHTPLAVPKLTDDTEGAARGNHTQPTVPELANDTAGATPRWGKL